jgi:phage baseplate assembly protein gpV
MQERRNQTNIYVNAIIKDVQNAFVREETTSFSESRIERIYEFEDGAIVKYEWQDEESSIRGENYNHRFTLIKLPTPNPGNLELGVLKTVGYRSGQ